MEKKNQIYEEDPSMLKFEELSGNLMIFLGVDFIYLNMKTKAWSNGDMYETSLIP